MGWTVTATDLKQCLINGEDESVVTGKNLVTSPSPSQDKQQPTFSTGGAI